MNEMTHEQLGVAFKHALRGMARLQARQEMLECCFRALIIEAPPARALILKALDTAKSDWAHRSAMNRPETPPEIDADAMALWNVLWQACASPDDLPPS